MWGIFYPDRRQRPPCVKGGLLHPTTVGSVGAVIDRPKRPPLTRGLSVTLVTDWGRENLLYHSLPPSFASQNPPPSSEGGKGSIFPTPMSGRLRRGGHRPPKKAPLGKGGWIFAKQKDWGIVSNVSIAIPPARRSATHLPLHKGGLLHPYPVEFVGVVIDRPYRFTYFF